MSVLVLELWIISDIKIIGGPYYRIVRWVVENYAVIKTGFYYVVEYGR